MALAEPILRGLGFDGERVATIETDDPDALGAALRAIPPMPPAPRPASFLPSGGKRDVLRVALRELHRAAPAPVDVVALPERAPFGAVEIDAAGCTLCLACVSACPTGALTRRPRAPDAALRRGRLRAVRTVQGDLPREGHHAQAAARLPRRHRLRRASSRRRSRSAASAAASRSASRARSSAWSPSSKASTGCTRTTPEPPRRHQDVRRLPRRRRLRAGLRSLRRPAARALRTTEDYLRERAEERGRRSDKGV